MKRKEPSIRRKTNNIISIEFYNMFVPSMTLKPIRKTTATYNVLHCVLQHVCAQHDPSQPHKKTTHGDDFQHVLQHVCAQHDPPNHQEQFQNLSFCILFDCMSAPSMTLSTIRDNQQTLFSIMFYSISVPSMTLQTKRRNCNHKAWGCFAAFDYAAITPQPQQMTEETQCGSRPLPTPPSSGNIIHMCVYRYNSKKEKPCNSIEDHFQQKTTTQRERERKRAREREREKKKKGAR